MPIPSFMRMRLMPVPGLCACARPSAVTVILKEYWNHFRFESTLVSLLKETNKNKNKDDSYWSHTNLIKIKNLK